MSTHMTRPIPRVAARRRRAFLWAPLLLAGALVTAAAGPMIGVFNSLDVAAIVLMTAGVLGFAWDAGK